MNNTMKVNYGHIDPDILKIHIVLFLFISAQIASTYSLLVYLDIENSLTLTNTLVSSLQGGVILLYMKLFRYFFKFRQYPTGSRNYKIFFSDINNSWGNINFNISIFLPLLLFPVFFSGFSTFKSSIPHLNPFYLDIPLAELDAFLHFGIDPWRITHFFFGSLEMTALINLFYNIWFFIVIFYLIYFISRNDLKDKRIHFFISFILCWAIIGCVFAALLSSAGPCFYERVIGDTYYVPLMDKLTEYNHILKEKNGFLGIWSLDVQELLWESYQNRSTALGRGISAMPSMHVSISTLLYLSARTFNKNFGYIMLVFLGIILIGSVHLGWHYALDGYVSIFLTYGIWKFSYWIVKKINLKENTPLFSQ